MSVLLLSLPEKIWEWTLQRKLRTITFKNERNRYVKWRECKSRPKLDLKEQSGNLAEVIRSGESWTSTALSHVRARSYLMKLRKVNLEETVGIWGTICYSVWLLLWSMFSSFPGCPHPTFLHRCRRRRESHTLTPTAGGVQTSTDHCPWNEAKWTSYNKFILGNHSLMHS